MARAVIVAAALAFLAGSPQGTSPPRAEQPVPAADAVAMPLTDTPGDPVRGHRIVRDLEKATCLICHAMPIPEEPNHGDIGPPLAGVGARLSAAQLRQRIVDPTAVNPATVMPPYFRTAGLNRVLARHAGQTIYTAQEVEDVVAYLATLTGP